jgi:hypothetical protein
MTNEMVPGFFSPSAAAFNRLPSTPGISLTDGTLFHSLPVPATYDLNPYPVIEASLPYQNDMLRTFSGKNKSLRPWLICGNFVP